MLESIRWHDALLPLGLAQVAGGTQLLLLAFRYWNETTGGVSPQAVDHG